MEEIILCNICGCELREEEDIYEVENEYFCRNCYDTHTFSCAGCEERFLYSNNYGDDTTCLCRDCYDEDYYHCHGCDCIIHREDTYWNNGEPYCYDCDSDYNGENYINEYSYKPSPKFYRCSDEKNVRYYGVELEIDEGGKDDDNAEILYNIANSGDDVMYIKYDGSLDEGMELVSHPCSLKYHKDCFHWKEVMQEAKNMYYRSHNTGTCGLHVHIGREQLGETYEQQEEVISRIMFFFESHWNELFRFSRRSEYALGRWASRYGYDEKPKNILEKAKKGHADRYKCVNITNFDTIEIRIFKGTLRWNTFMATLELVDAVCENAMYLNDDEIRKQSWNDFVMGICSENMELIKYLKEKRLYVNEPFENEEEI